MNNKFELINHIIKLQGYKDYVELGYGNGETFENIIIPGKISVDNIITKANYIGTTDAFFKLIGYPVDAYFIDACHEYSQVNKDFANSMQWLNEGGTIFMHDVGPERERDTLETASGTAYFSWMDLRTAEDLNCFSYRFPNGDVIGMVIRGNQEILKNPEYTWKYYNDNRDLLLQVKTLEEIEEIFKNYEN